MGRVTIEHCIKNVDSHFDLILVAAERAKQINDDKKSKIVKKGPKSHVVALREIEDNSINIEEIRNRLIYRCSHPVEAELVEDNSVEEEIVEELETSEFINGEIEEINDDSYDLIIGDEETLIP